MFLIAIGLPKKEFVGTAAWFFLLLNLLKIPFSWNLGLIRSDTLALNVVLLPGIYLGLVAGSAISKRIRQRDFETVIVVLAALAGLHMLLA
jgi:hypothetical protein